MKHVVIGTAGHIDHGKTALVKALTGIDADRLAEEKRRGITIDLGFAQRLELVVPGVRAGFVDVPGHERFVKNMLAGTGGIDLVLLVVAADESIKPQTREHFDICRLLGIGRGVVALTKADLVDAEIAGLVRLEVEELTAGSFLEGAAMLPVSALTGAATSRSCARRWRRRRRKRPSGSRARISGCRSTAPFAVKGFGAVVTGTLIAGSVQLEDEVELFPEGRRLRVRGIEVHGEKVGRALAGQRTAINLAGTDAAELRRGQMLAAPGVFRAVKRIDCRLKLLESAKPLKHRAPVHFHAGTAEIEGEVRLLDGTTLMKPGETRFVRIELREEALLVHGDRFIVRKFSPVVTIGRGRGDRCWRRAVSKGREPCCGQRKNWASPDSRVRVAMLVREAEFGRGLAELMARTGWTVQEVKAAVAAPVRTLEGGGWFADETKFRSARERLVKAVSAYHKANPLQPGVAKAELRGREFAAAPPAVFEELLAGAPELAAEGELVRLKTHRVALKDDEEKARAAIEGAFAKAGLAVPAVERGAGAIRAWKQRARGRCCSSLVRERRSW